MNGLVLLALGLGLLEVAQELVRGVLKETPAPSRWLGGTGPQSDLLRFLQFPGFIELARLLHQRTRIGVLGRRQAVLDRAGLLGSFGLANLRQDLVGRIFAPPFDIRLQ